MKKPAPAADAGAVLRARARQLARREHEPLHEEGAGQALELLEFRLGRDGYALESRHVREVLPLRDLAPVPCTPDFVAGVTNVRGRITAVVDIQRFLRAVRHGLADFHHVILLQGDGMELGLLAYGVEGVRRYAVNELQPAPPWHGLDAGAVKGVTPTGLLVIDVPRVLADPRLLVHEEVGP